MNTNPFGSALAHTASALRLQVEAFLFHEARLLDERRWAEWRELFAPDGDYWMPVEPGQPDPIDHVSLIYETHADMALRIRRFAHPQLISQQPPSRTAHAVGNVMIDAVDEVAGTLDVYAVFQVTEIRAGTEQRFAGHYRIRLARCHAGLPFRIVRKTVLLLNSDAPLSNIYVYL